jgi:hypothetical protein
MKGNPAHDSASADSSSGNDGPLSKTQSMSFGSPLVRDEAAVDNHSLHTDALGQIDPGEGIHGVHRLRPEAQGVWFARKDAIARWRLDEK